MGQFFENRAAGLEMTYLNRGLCFSHQIDHGEKDLVDISIKMEPEFFENGTF